MNPFQKHTHFSILQILKFVGRNSITNKILRNAYLIRVTLPQNRDIAMACGFGEDRNLRLNLDVDLYSLNYGYQYFKSDNTITFKIENTMKFMQNK